ncbi:unnamed protein product, partial [Owenia fusiformis]
AILDCSRKFTYFSHFRRFIEMAQEPEIMAWETDQSYIAFEKFLQQQTSKRPIGDDDLIVLDFDVEEVNKAIEAELPKHLEKEIEVLTDLEHQVKQQEKKNNEVKKVFARAETDLKKFKAALEAEQELAKQQAEVESVSDSDDEIQIIEASIYEPPSSKKSPRLPPSPRQPQQGQQQTLVKLIRKPGTQPVTSIQTLQQVQLNTNVNDDIIPLEEESAPPPPKKNPVLKPQSKTPLRIIELTVGMKLYARKNNDVWYKGTLIEIIGLGKTLDLRKYKVKYDSKGVKLLTGKDIALADKPSVGIIVGSRICALYKDDDGGKSHYAGIIAEPPSVTNRYRYLVFFDDGYAQYCSMKEIHKVYEQSRNVWEDIHPDSQDFIKGYLAQYPERPMVRLQAGQIIKTEWNGAWWTAKVHEVDASLVKMYFDADRRVEWIYRGSTRLEPLYTELSNAEHSKSMGAKARRHVPHIKSNKKPFVEYTRGEAESVDEVKAPVAKTDPPVKKKSGMNVAKKSTAGQKVRPGPLSSKPAGFTTSLSMESVATKDIASVLKDRLGENPDVDDESMGERKSILQRNPQLNANRKLYRHHRCSKGCSKNQQDPVKFRGNNPLIIPMMCSWERQLGKMQKVGRRQVFYRAPCGRRIRSMEELDYYLRVTDCLLTVDMFCFDPYLHTHSEFVPLKTFCDIKDLSYGKESVPISCVNGIDRQYPDYVEYSNVRIPAKGVALNLDPDFLVGCDCTDNCSDPRKCSCCQLTVHATKATGGDVKPNAGYQYRCLNEPLVTGVYECNSRCKCNSRCNNRVAQQPLSLRLQVFKTEKRGWGLRCLDDIQAGGFICIYAGQLLTEQGANEDGHQYGDEYLAELDHIEVVENLKEGYESDVVDPDDEGSSDDDEDESMPSDNKSDSTFDGRKYLKDKNRNSSESGDTRIRNSPRSIQQQKSSTKQTAEWVKNIPEPDDCIVLSDDDSNSKSQEPNDDDNDSDDRNRRKKDRSRFRNLPDPKSNKTYRIQMPSEEKKKEKLSKPEKEKYPSTRRLISGEDFCYIMDAKSIGNIGRYLNHCCSPNVFVQNVFVDTQDLRFPWVAFFALQYIRAGTELTWDYSYEVGSVPGKVLYCYCGSAECRGRLL